MLAGARVYLKTVFKTYSAPKKWLNSLIHKEFLEGLLSQLHQVLSQLHQAVVSTTPSFVSTTPSLLSQLHQVWPGYPSFCCLNYTKLRSVPCLVFYLIIYPVLCPEFHLVLKRGRDDGYLKA